MQLTPNEWSFLSLNNVLWLGVFCDALLALALVIIALALVTFVVQRRDLPFKTIFVLVAAFVALCGLGRALAIWTRWHAVAGLPVALDALTALAAVATAGTLISCIPKALALRGPRELEQRNLSLQSVGEEIQATIEYLGEGVVVFDEHLNVVRANRLAQQLIAVRDAHDMVVDADGVLLPGADWPVAAARVTGQPQRTLMGVGPEDARRWIAVSATPVRLPGSNNALDRIVMSLREVTDLKTREQQQRDYARQLHSLHLIATMTTDQRKKQIEAALLVGLEPLGLERAFLCAIDVASNELVIECSVALPDDASPPINVGTRFPLRDNLVGRVVKRRDVLTILDLAAEPAASDDVPYLGRGSYIAVPIFVDGVAYGTIGFVGHTPRKEPFTRENIEFVKLAGDLIASALLRESQTERLDALAFFDALTGLPNRVLLYDRLVQMINASERRGERFAVLYLDLDGFKSVNDRCGHAAGDAVLKSVGARLKEEVLRESDTVARLGGDEFIIVAAGIATRSDAAAFAERVVRTLRQPIDDGEQIHRISTSIGISMFPANGTDMTTLIDQADIALYEAKHSGKNRFRFAPDDHRTDIEFNKLRDEIVRDYNTAPLAEFTDGGTAP